MCLIPAPTRVVLAAALATLTLTSTLCLADEVQAGVFRLTPPASMKPVMGRALEQLQQAMQGGAKSLAERSGLANPRDASTIGASFFHAYRTLDGRVTVTFMGNPLAEPSDLEQMLQAGRQRVNWGVESGQLRRGSGVSRQDVDGVPCLLQNIEHASGARIRTWMCFVPTMPKVQVSIAAICDDQATCDRNRADLDSVIASVRVGNR